MTLVTPLILALLNQRGLGPSKTKKLLAQADLSEITTEQQATAWLRDKGIFDPQNAFAAAQRMLSEQAKHGISAVAWLLSHLASRPGFPPLLWFRGDLEILSLPMIAIIGTREASERGRQWAADASEALARSERPAALLNGLARGIDLAAWEASATSSTPAVACLDLKQLLCFKYPNALGIAIPNVDPRYAGIAHSKLQGLLATGLIVCETGPTGGSFHTVQSAAKNKSHLASCLHPDGHAAQGHHRLLKEFGATAIADKSDLQVFIERSLS